MRADYLASRLVATPDNSQEIRQRLRLYLGYRIFLACLLILLMFTDFEPVFLGSSAPGLYGVTIVAYLIMTIASFALCQSELAMPDGEYFLAILVDSVVVSLMIHASGGPSSGLGLLLATSIAVAAFGMSGRIALLAAATACLAVLAESLYSMAIGYRSNPDMPQVAMLGAAYFALAILAHELSSRAAASEKLARKQGIDIANLTELNEYIIQQMQTGVVVLDEEHRIRMLNDAAWSLLDMPDSAIGHDIGNIFPVIKSSLIQWEGNPDDRQFPLSAPSSDANIQVQFTSLGDTGSQGTLIFLEDASRAAEAAQQIKLASLGRLIASIAHEIRNPLGAISHANQLMIESGNLEGPDKRMSEIIDKNATRVNEVIENILSLSRRHIPQPEPLLIRPWLEQAASELCTHTNLSPDQVTLHVSPPDTTLYSDKKQLSQIINTLLENAIRHYPETELPLHLSISAGTGNSLEQPFIEITDNGKGIPQEAVDKIFDPFFTTRNDGTGLGLYVTKMLCDSNNIRIRYIPVTGGGSCFRLRFPEIKPE